MLERSGRSGWELRSRARDQARWLIRDHGDGAEAVLAAKLNRPILSASDRYRYQCTERELRRLREIEAEARRSTTSLVIWVPPRISLGLLVAKLTGKKQRRRRRRS